MSNVLVIKLPEVSDAQRIVRMIPEIALSNTQTARSFWLSFASALVDGPVAEVARHAERIAECSVAAYGAESASFSGDSGSHADFRARNWEIRIGYLGGQSGNHPTSRFFISLKYLGEQAAATSVFARMLAAIVLDQDAPLAQAPTSFADFRGTMPAAMALVYCILPLTYAPK